MLSDGAHIPQIGFGVCGIAPHSTQGAVEHALETGYRHIDTATIYKNEREVGTGIAASAVDRADIFVTGKLWNTDQGFETAIEACEKSLELLGFDYLDMYLIHWAQSAQAQFVRSWDALIELQKRGLVKSIGVSNFTTEQLDALKPSGVTPVVHQIELHPLLNQQQQRADNSARNIVTEAWSPLGQGKDLSNETIAAIAAQHGATPAQVIIAWHLQLGNVVIPKSVTPQRIRSNFEALQLTLSEQEMREISALPQGARLGADPAEGDLGAPTYSDRDSFNADTK
ncbi:MAG: aldo/keto reductase [Rothia sp. (in: high G+C Gram-positive bacteria)]|nr:aldo/keto reductase [Rothia sp. (in: high G+C Gram-positive bacteria)]